MRCSRLKPRVNILRDMPSRSRAVLLISQPLSSSKNPLTHSKMTLTRRKKLRNTLMKQIYKVLGLNLRKSLRKSPQEKARKKTPTSLTFFLSHFFLTKKILWTTKIRSMKKRLPKWTGDLEKRVRKEVFWPFFKCYLEVNQQHNIKTKIGK